MTRREAAAAASRLMPLQEYAAIISAIRPQGKSAVNEHPGPDPEFLKFPEKNFGKPIDKSR